MPFAQLATETISANWRDPRELTHLCCKYFLIRTGELLIKGKKTLTP